MERHEPKRKIPDGCSHDPYLYAVTCPECEGDVIKGEDFMRALPDICESLFPHAVDWRECVYSSNVHKGVVHGQDNRDEIKVLDEFIAICKTLGLNELGITEQDIAETMPPRPEDER